MRESEIAVKFQPHGKTVHVMPGTPLHEAAVLAGITLNTPCGGRGTCGKCRVRVVDHPGEPTQAERARLSGVELANGMRLACQSSVHGPMTVEVPETSVLASAFQILGGAQDGAAADVTQVVVRKRYVELPPPAREDEMPDIERLERALGCAVHADLPLLRELPVKLRRAGYKGTAVLAEGRLLDFEPGDTRAECHAVAVDVGTTTIAAVLLDLNTGRELAATARMNPQTAFGDDVISRILHARQHPEGLGELQRAVIGEINAMLTELCAQAGTRPACIYEMVLSGNTTMQQLLAGIDSAALGEVPFSPAMGRGVSSPGVELGLAMNPRGRAYLFPVIGGFVGGDTVSGLVATGFAEAPHPVAFVDIGTNGEIAVGMDGRMVAASTAAGPAFEGARITHGMRATSGAIEKVVFDGDVRISVIGNVAPVGLCGSALVDAAAELLRCGALMPEGLLLAPEWLPEDLPAAIRERVIVTEEGGAFVLASAAESATGAPILLTQRDIRELQLATAAIRAGFSILVRRAGLELAQVERVLLAGGFGNFIRRRNAQQIGLLPMAVEQHRIDFVGNTSLAGARIAAASLEVRRRAEVIARGVKHIDLSIDPEFQMEYVEAMTFPEPDSRGASS